MSNAPNTVADQNWHKRGSSRNTDTFIFVTICGGFPPFCTLCLYVVYVMCMYRPYSWEGAFVLFPCDMRVIDYRCGIVANGIYAFAR